MPPLISSKRPFGASSFVPLNPFNPANRRSSIVADNTLCWIERKFESLILLLTYCFDKLTSLKPI